MYAATDPTAHGPAPRRRRAHRSTRSSSVPARPASRSATTWPARGMRFLLVDAAPEIGHSWATRWDSLRLFTPAEYSSLPGMAFPAAPGHLPGQGPGRRLPEGLRGPVRPPRHAQHPRPTRSTSTEGPVPGRHQPGHPVGPAGHRGHRTVPAARHPRRRAAGSPPTVTQLHSSTYRNPSDLPRADAGKVLVVGAGNSGLQIALEVARTHQVHLAVGTRQKTVPQRPLGRDLFWWLTKTGVVTRPATSPVAAWFRKRGGDLVIGTTWDDIDAAGIHVHPRLTTADGRTAQFATSHAVDDVAAVVWATGFRPDYSWLDVPGVWDGHQVVHQRGASAVPGLWFIGLPWQHTRGSALLGFVGDDATWVADQVASHVPTRPTPGARA